MDIHKISLLSAIGCNLQCKYCNIDKTLNNSVSTILNNTIEALKDGSYLNNIISILNKFDQPIKNIESIEIWGQEPTMTLMYLADKWEDWANSFINLDRIFFSTNGMANIDSIIYFIKQVDKYSKRQLVLNIQVSYDGEKSTNEIRGANSNIIKENISALILFLNSYQFKNIKVDIFFHGVLSNYLAKQLNDFNKLEEYINEIDIFLNDLRSISMNKFVSIGTMTLQNENGGEYTTEDGVILAEIMRKLDYIKNSKQTFINEHQCPISLDIIGGVSEIILDKFRTDKDIINQFILNPNEHTFCTFCAPLVGDLKVMYDGTIVSCQNAIYDIFGIEEDKVEKNIRNYARISEYKHNHLFNPLTASDEIIDTYINYVEKSMHNGVGQFMLSTLANYIYIMAKTGQVSSSYLTDFEKIKRHAFYLTNINTCYYNLVVLSGSAFTRNTSDIRLFCNGVLDLLDKDIEDILNV